MPLPIPTPVPVPIPVDVPPVPRGADNVVIILALLLIFKLGGVPVNIPVKLIGGPNDARGVFVDPCPSLDIVDVLESD